MIQSVRKIAYANFLKHMEIVKTVEYYIRALRRAVLNFFRMDMDAFEFIDEMVRLIDGQFTRAWNEGAREVGVDPKDMDEEDLAILQDRKDQEQEYILGFASDIETARIEQAPITPLYNRVEMWANRYNEVKSDAMIHFGGKKKLEWQLGSTEQHCETCSQLNGIVAWAKEWEQSGIHPQGAPNGLLECGGWKCDCRLGVTDKRRTSNALETLMDIAASRNV
jgi:hypothetical protein